MVRKTTVQLVDAIDGSEAAETASFGLDGNSYEIDLSEQRASSLRAAVSSRDALRVALGVVH